MRFADVNLFGVYVAPISVMLVAAWLVTIALRRVAARFGLPQILWLFADRNNGWNESP